MSADTEGITRIDLREFDDVSDAVFGESAGGKPIVAADPQGFVLIGISCGKKAVWCHGHPDQARGLAELLVQAAAEVEAMRK